MLDILLVDRYLNTKSIFAICRLMLSEWKKNNIKYIKKQAVSIDLSQSFITVACEGGCMETRVVISQP